MPLSSCTVDLSFWWCSLTSDFDFSPRNVNLIGVFEEDSTYVLFINLTSS